MNQQRRKPLGLWIGMGNQPQPQNPCLHVEFREISVSMKVRVYWPTSSTEKIPKPTKHSEFEIQATVWAHLIQDGHLVRGCVPAFHLEEKAKCTFDLVVYRQNGTPMAIIEIKNSKGTRLEKTRQGRRYRAYGLPVILFWDISKYPILIETLNGL